MATRSWEAGAGTFTATGVKSAEPLPETLVDSKIVRPPTRDESGSPLPILWFDIDNTLYSRSTRISDMMGEKIFAYFRRIGLDDKLAHELHLKYYSMYGLALRGLVKHHNVDALDYDKHCDGALDLDSILKPDPKIRKVLLDIDRSKVRVWALTNAYINHARRVLRLLNVLDQFEGIVYADYAKQNFACKPERAFFTQAMEEVHCMDPSKHYIIDDSAINIKGAKEVGWHSCVHFREPDDERPPALEGVADAFVSDLDELRQVPGWRDFFVE